LDWLARCPERTAFSRSEAFQALKDRRDVKTAALTSAFRVLVEHGFIRLSPPKDAKPGPVPETYAVNPQWDRATTE
jgi:hypothetical protein